MNKGFEGPVDPRLSLLLAKSFLAELRFKKESFAPGPAGKGEKLVPKGELNCGCIVGMSLVLPVREKGNLSGLNNPNTPVDGFACCETLAEEEERLFVAKSRGTEDCVVVCCAVGRGA